jgi:ribonuclease P protein component
MFNKAHRINSREFSELFKTGKKIHSDTFFIIYKQDDKPARYAVSVSKKKAKHAIDRNRIRRQIYAHLREYSAQQTGAYIVVIKNLPINLEKLTESINAT